MTDKSTLNAALEHRASYRLVRFVLMSTATPSHNTFQALIRHMANNNLAAKVRCGGDSIRTLVIYTQVIAGRGLSLVATYAVNADSTKPTIP